MPRAAGTDTPAPNVPLVHVRIALDAAHGCLCTSQGQNKYQSSERNPAYEQGFRGYTMMNGAGTDMLIPYAHVGRLALRVFNELKPLMDGPFGEGADVPFKAINSIKLVISEGPLEQETFLTIDSFVEAINAIPDPVQVSPLGSPAGGPSSEEVQKAFKELYDSRDAMNAEMKVLNDLQRMMTIMDPGLKALTDRVNAMVTEISSLKAEVARLKQ